MMKTQPVSILLFLVAALFSCSGGGNKGTSKSKDFLKQAEQIAQETIITDGHIDVPYRLIGADAWIDLSENTSPEGDFDFVRATKGGLNVPFMSIYIPASYQKTGGAKDFADKLIDLVHKIADKSPDKFAIATSPQEAEAIVEKGMIALPMGMENGAGIEDKLENVAYFHKRGIRYITLTHGKDNLIGDSSYDTTGTWQGLSPFGKEVVAEMNRVGIMVDISHISDKTFTDVMKFTKAPVIASHSSCRHFTEGFERNMSTEMIAQLKDNGGVIQINFGSKFISDDVSAKNNERTAAWNMAKKGLEGEELAKARKEFDAKNPKQYASVEQVADHIDLVVKTAGIDHVGLGSDFDGVGDSLPIGLKDVSQYPNLIAELLKRGYSEEDIQKICYKNVWRVWNKVADVAKQLQSE